MLGCGEEDTHRADADGDDEVLGGPHYEGDR